MCYSNEWILTDVFIVYRFTCTESKSLNNLNNEIMKSSENHKILER